MGLNHRHNPVGVDVVIDKLQRDLFIELTNKFCWTKYESFDRVYRNKKGDEIIPEAYTKNGEYKEVLFNDKQTVTSFFISDDTRTWDGAANVFTQGISLIVQADLKKLFPDVKHRADEELIDNIFKALKKKGWDVRFEGVTQGVDKVYESLKVTYNKKYFDDMGNFSVARFNFKVLYINTNCITQAIK